MIEADNSKVICPKCCHQFTAICVNDQDERSSALAEIERLEAERDAAVADARRYQWLTEDLDIRHGRETRNQILDRMPVMTYSSASAAIDAAIAKGEAP